MVQENTQPTASDRVCSGGELVIRTLEKKGVTRGDFCGQEINGLFDNQRDNELKKIHGKKTDQSQGEGPAILNKVFFNGQEISKCL